MCISVIFGLVCINKAKTIQNIIQQHLVAEASIERSSQESPLLSSIKKIADNKDENELQNVEMSIDVKR